MPSIIEKVRKKLRDLDREIDRNLSVITTAADEVRVAAKGYKKGLIEGAVKAKIISEKTKKKLDEKGDKVTKRLSDVDITDIGRGVLHFLLYNPRLSIVIVAVIGLLITLIGLPMAMSNISGDMEVYIPKGGATEQIVNEIRNEPNSSWSVDIAIIYVTTGNAYDTTNMTNITNVRVLQEMTLVEEALDYNRTDYGKEDHIKFVLSIAQMIREINNTPPQFEKALEEEFPNAWIIFDKRNLEGNYSIPSQERVDEIVAYLPEDILSTMVVDSNNDTIYDTAGIMIGFDKEISVNEISSILHKTVENSNISYANMKITGPVAITQSLTDRTYSEIMVIFPLAMLFVAMVLVAFHRNIKIVIIEGVPIGLTMGITFGILGFTGWVITPQALFVAPVLIPLGVAYGLYIANAYSAIGEKKSDDTILPHYTREERMLHAIKQTSRPIFLSALTTAIGFASLLSANMLPMRILGFGLSVGILVAYVLTTLTVPSLILILNYEKRARERPTRFIRSVPIKNRKKLIVVSLIITLLSVSVLPNLKANMDLLELAPADDITVTTMKEFSSKFKGGQLSLAIIRGLPARESNTKHSLKDVDVLDNIETMEAGISTVENAKPLSVVDVMKMVRVPGGMNITTPYPYLNDLLNATLGAVSNKSFWEAIHALPNEVIPYFQKSPRQIAIDLFYNTLTPELRGMFVNEDYSKTLLYVNMPAMDTVHTKMAVEDINWYLANKGPAITSTSKLTGFAPVLVEINDLLYRNAINTLAVAIVLVLIVLILIFRSIKYGIITLLPVLFVVSWEPLSFYLLGIDMNLLTALIGAIMIGIGIDFCIHMTENILKSGVRITSVEDAVEKVGLSFFEATVTVTMGISAIFIANIPSINQFVEMVILLLIFSMLCALFVLPALYAVYIKRG